MNTPVVNVKVDPEVKKEAQQIAEGLGFSLSSLINAYLRQLIRDKTVAFTASEEPSPWLIKALKESREDIKAGRVVSFERAEDAEKYFEALVAAGERKNKKS